ncbi:carbohydrate ABC transporter permease [Paenibacillus thalictri]|uniref:Sugar ABC transporter permease n=1 Tax=Paenibacillus thalictri TaxID=2527873 RepID=A0A4Q9DXR9_9BACL|nr:sugar ABC transporter permease [Paenibacillus thalictri]TBL80598.1 sugar ABC transporter permease [Paenibacillus thalictri]
MLKHKTKYQYVGLLYVAPWLVGFLAFQLYPFIVSFIYSFTDFSILKAMHFVGFDNYVHMFTADKKFFQSVKVTLVYVFFSVPCKLAFALFIAMLLNMKLKSINFFRTAYYLPSILGGSIAISILWGFLFNTSGLVNILLSKLHVPPVNWLGSPNVAIYTISLLAVWQFGSSMVLFLAGLKNIPGELYEAARVDGARKGRMFIHITLPLLTPIIFFNLIMQMINAFQEFTSAYVITQGGPLDSTYLYGLMLYENAFKYTKMGYASAQSWFLFVIILIFTIGIFKSSKYWTFYEDGGDL